jgi:hypothetical protein
VLRFVNAPMKATAGFPLLPPDSLIYIIKGIAEAVWQKTSATLAEQPREKIVKMYRDALWQRRRRALWMLGEELCRRGVPPSLRPSVFLGGDPCVPREDVLLLDLQWLCLRYPKHPVLIKRWRGLFEPKNFVWTAATVLNRGLHQPSVYIRLLGLTYDQQVETVYLRGKSVQSRFAVIEGLAEQAKDALKTKHMARPRAREQGNWRAIIDRRFMVWKCGSMADWYPKRTAELFEAASGEAISRQLAHKIIEEVWRDFPISRPEPKRGRRRRQATETRAPVQRRRRSAVQAKKKRPRRSG